MGRLVQELEEAFPSPWTPVYVFSNHDRVRSFFRLGENEEKARLLAAFQLTVRGVPVIYYGEEIGMNQHKLPLKQAQDSLTDSWKWLPDGLHRIVRKFGLSLNRDECRTPMQWTSEPGCGFTSGKPWVEPVPDFPRKNVDEQLVQARSLWNHYRFWLHFRRNHAALHSGSLQLLDGFPPTVLAWLRNHPEQLAICLFNFSDKKQAIDPKPHRLFTPDTWISTHSETTDPANGLFPWEARVLIWKQR
jgi:glycosidase